MPFPLIPSFAGIFWYLVTKKPALVAKFILKTPFSISTMASVAKWVFGLTTAHYLSSTLTSFSRNNWRLADTHRWQWNKEVAVVTGGCSGIGEEIVKALSKKGVKVVILDVTALPDRLNGGKFARRRWLQGEAD
jgi:all-trans-retinol dehydrogenase (NAD+)